MRFWGSKGSGGDLCEVLREPWRIVHDPGWISAQQLLYVMGRIDESGRMIGGWIRHLQRAPDSTPR